MLKLFAGIKPALVGIEACHTAHYWAREIAALGHEVRLMPPQFVKPYVKSQKNDAADAEAICEAVQRPTMRFVPTKSAEQQAVSPPSPHSRSPDPTAQQSDQCDTGALCGIWGRFTSWCRDVDRLLVPVGETQRDLPALAREMLGILAAQLRESMAAFRSSKRDS